jgi:hypothetical protein
VAVVCFLQPGIVVDKTTVKTTANVLAFGEGNNFFMIVGFSFSRKHIHRQSRFITDLRGLQLEFMNKPYKNHIPG